MKSLQCKLQYRTQLARKDLGMNDKTIYNWIKVYKKENNITTPIDETKNQSKSSQQELLTELKQLRAENKLLKQEKDILKKVTTYFGSIKSCLWIYLLKYHQFYR